MFNKPEGSGDGVGAVYPAVQIEHLVGYILCKPLKIIKVLCNKCLIIKVLCEQLKITEVMCKQNVSSLKIIKGMCKECLIIRYN